MQDDVYNIQDRRNTLCIVSHSSYIESSCLDCFSTLLGDRSENHLNLLVHSGSDNFAEIYKVNDIINRNFVSWTAYITVITFVVILTAKLLAASKFRLSLQSVALTRPTITENSNPQSDRKEDNCTASHWPTIRKHPLICLQRICRLLNPSH